MMPSAIKLCSIGVAASALEAMFCSAPVPPSIKSMKGPAQVYTDWNTTYIMPTNTTSPQKRCSSNWSILSVAVRFLSAACRSMMSLSSGFKKRKRKIDSAASGLNPSLYS